MSDLTPRESIARARAKLTPKQRDEIRVRYANGETAPALALEYGVGVGTIAQYTDRRR